MPKSLVRGRNTAEVFLEGIPVGGCMFRFAFKLILWVTVARWMYAEAAMIAPSSVPYIEAALMKIQIPTHDQWDETQLGRQVLSLLPSRGELKSRVVAQLDAPIRDSGITLQNVGYAVAAGRRTGSRFEEF